MVNLLGGPAADGVAAVQENLDQPDDPHVLDFDSRIADRADSDGQSQPLQQGKVHMDIETLSLETGESVRDDLESLPHRIQMVESLLQTEVAQIVGAKFVAEKAGELLILFEKGALPVSVENVMTMLVFRSSSLWVYYEGEVRNDAVKKPSLWSRLMRRERRAVVPVRVADVKERT